MAWPTVTIVTTDMDAGTDSAASARAQIKQMADNVNAIKDAKGAASGIAELDSGGLIPIAEIPVITADKGGTGQSSYAIGDIFYANTTTTLAKLAASISGYVLTANGAGAAPSWQAAGGGFVGGTRMSFQQTAAPTGWTKDITAAINDSIMRLNTGTVGSGGSLAFSTWAAVTADGATTLSLAQIPSHAHNITSKSGAGATGPSNAGTVAATAVSTDSQGGGGSHTHSLSQNLKYYDFIIASKN